MTPTLSLLSFGHELGATDVTVTRTTGVPDVLWLKVQSEWGTRGRFPGVTISVPVSVFLSRLDWVAPYCRSHGVKVEWRGDAADLVKRRMGGKSQIEDALKRLKSIDGLTIDKKLTNTRFTRRLRSFQLRDLGKLLALANGANFSVPGAGKTSVAYATYEFHRHAGEVDRLLVVSPLSAFESWQDEAAACFNPAPKVACFTGGTVPSTEILLVNYQRLQTGFQVLAEWVASGRTHMILDEAHRMKRGWSGEWGRNCLNLANLAIRRDILTGTPAPHSILDLDALFDFVWPGEARRLIPKSAADPATVHTVSRRIAPLFVRTTKAELELPDPLISTTNRPLDPLHREIYGAISGYFGTMFHASRRARLDMRAFGRVVMYLLEAATNPSLLIAGSHAHDPILFRHPPLKVPEGTELDDLLRTYADYETPWKFRYLKTTIKRNARHGRKTLVWSNFLRNLETLRHFELKEFRPAMIHGGVRDREAELTRFRSDDDCHVLLANPAALAEGISLHYVCHDAIYLERTFNAGHYLQSVDRIHRLGLHPDTVTRVTILISTDTIDDVVDSRLREKTERLGALLQDPDLAIMALPAVPEEGLLV